MNYLMFTKRFATEVFSHKPQIITIINQNYTYKIKELIICPPAFQRYKKAK